MPDGLSTTGAARRLATTRPTVRALLERGDLRGQRERRGSRFVWTVDEGSVTSFLEKHGPFDGKRRSKTRLTPTGLAQVVEELRVAVEHVARTPEAGQTIERERDELRSTVIELQDAVARLRDVAELQREADDQRAIMIEHLLAAAAAGERADNSRRVALQKLEDALAGLSQPPHPPA